MNEQLQLKFPGFPEKPIENYWQYPQIMNGFWHALTPIEQKILDYILRHTWGWQKTSDRISYRQLKSGIVGVDKGTGIRSNATLSKGLKGLVAKNMIEKISGKEKGISNFYSLVLNKGVQEMNRGSTKVEQGGCSRNEHTINNKTINNKEEDKNLLRASSQVNDLIELFKEINPFYKKFYANKTYRKCLEEIVSTFGLEKTRRIIEFLPTANSVVYGGIKITNPYELQRDMGKLKILIDKEKAKKQSKGKQIIGL